MTASAGACTIARMDELQDTARRFLNELLRATGWKPTRLAKAAGVSHTTLTRFLNKQDFKSTISLRTLDAVRTAAAREIPVDQIDNLWLLVQKRPSSTSQRQKEPN